MIISKCWLRASSNMQDKTLCKNNKKPDTVIDFGKNAPSRRPHRAWNTPLTPKLIPEMVVIIQVAWYKNTYELSHNSKFNITNIRYWLDNMRNEKNIGQIVRDKRAITSLSLAWKISAFCYFNIYQGKKITTIYFSF